MISPDKIHRQRGQAATEFLIIAPVALLMIFSCLQFALIYQAKTALEYAAFNAVRYAAVRGATKASIERGFASGFAPFYTYAPDGDAVPYAVSKVYGHIDDGLIVFNRINPPAEAFLDFSDELVDDADTGWKAIPNDNLMYRDAERGAQTQLNIQDANLLKVGVLYCYPLSFPLVNRMIASAVRGVSHNNFFITRNQDNQATTVTNNGDYCQQVSQASTPSQPSIPIMASAIIRMQSNVLDDPAWN